MRTDLCLRYEPHKIACAAIFLAARILHIKLPGVWHFLQPAWRARAGAASDLTGRRGGRRLAGLVGAIRHGANGYRGDLQRTGGPVRHAKGALARLCLQVASVITHVLWLEQLAYVPVGADDPAAADLLPPAKPPVTFSLTRAGAV